ncbi:hypothetical protein Tco_1306342, partial [Tanacetum coccineum]
MLRSLIPPVNHNLSMDEGFTAVAYPDVQENLKLTVDEQVILEEPVSSTGTLSSLQHLAKDFSFGPSDPIIIKRMGELEEFIAYLVEENQALETRRDKQGSRIKKLETMDLPKMIKEQMVEFIDSQ